MSACFQRTITTFVLSGMAGTLLRLALYLRPGPMGSPYVLDIAHYLPHSVFYCWYGAALVWLPAALLAALADRRGRHGFGRGVWLSHIGLCCALLLIDHFNHEIQRFMGVRLSLDFLRTYGAFWKQPDAIGSAIAMDDGGRWSAVWLALVPPAFAVVSVWLGSRRPFPLPAGRPARVALLSIIAGLTLVWPFLTWNVIAGGSLRRYKMTPAPILIYQEASEWLSTTTRDYSDIDAHVRLVQDEWRRGDPLGQWILDDPRYPLRRRHVTGRSGPADDPPNFIVISLETFRAKDMKAFNPRLETQPTPFLDDLAADSLSAYWPRFHAAGLPTVYAFMAMHAGLLPHSRKRVATSFGTASLDSFPRVLRNHGYHTAFYTGSDPDWDSQRLWLERWYDETMYDPADQEQDRLVLRKAAERARELGRSSRPFLLTVFTISNHLPFDPPEERFAAPRGASVFARLHGSMRYVDDAVREFYQAIRDQPFFDRTVLIVTGDHGYDLGDRGFSGGHDNLRHESIWVPLIIHGAHPALPRGRQEAVASHVDLAPTVLDIAGIRADSSFFGHSLLHRSAKTARAYVVRGRNSAAASARWSVFFEDIESADGRSFVYLADDLSQEREIDAADDPEVKELRARARSLRIVMDYLYERDLVAPPAPQGGRPGVPETTAED